MLHSLCGVLAATNSVSSLVISLSFSSLAWSASVIAWYWLCTAVQYKLCSGEMSLNYGSVSSCSLTCLGSETVILIATFSSEWATQCSGIWPATASREWWNCWHHSLQKSIHMVLQNCLAKKAILFFWVSVTKEASDTAGILPAWCFLHSLPLSSSLSVAVVFFPSQMT